MKKITLSAFEQELIICPEMGGSILAYNVTVADQKRAIYRDSSNAVHVLESCNFPLVPYSNRIKKGCFPWQESMVQLVLNSPPETGSIHGHGWQASWQVVLQTTTKVEIEYIHQANDWPFNYVAQQSFELTAAGLVHTLSIKNVSEKPMPAGLGFHPYFYRTPLCRISVDADQMWAVDNICLPTQLVDVPKDLNNLNGRVVNSLAIDNCLTGFKQSAGIIWPEWKLKTEMTASSQCGFAVVYSPKGENFVCIEPVTHCTDAFNMYGQGYSESGTVSLSANETLSIWMALKTSELDS